MVMAVKVRYQEGVLRPLKEIEKIQEGKVFTIEIKPDLKNWKGVLKGLKISSVDLQHKIKEIWRSFYVSP
jgi:predicted DNA-binding antitoxin AbrB/MazE fold protein